MAQKSGYFTDTTRSDLMGTAIVPQWEMPGTFRASGSSVLRISQLAKQHRQRVALRFVEYRQEVRAANDHQRTEVVHYAYKNACEGEEGWHSTRAEHDQRCEAAVHS